jgi:hypothetical protein
MLTPETGDPVSFHHALASLIRTAEVIGRKVLDLLAAGPVTLRHGLIAV